MCAIPHKPAGWALHSAQHAVHRAFQFGRFWAIFISILGWFLALITFGAAIENLSGVFSYSAVLPRHGHHGICVASCARTRARAEGYRRTAEGAESERRALQSVNETAGVALTLKKLCFACRLIDRIDTHAHLNTNAAVLLVCAGTGFYFRSPLWGVMSSISSGRDIRDDLQSRCILRTCSCCQRANFRSLHRSTPAAVISI